MRISTRGRYGVKAVLELARHYGRGPMSVRELADKAQISSAYLEQLFRKLKEAQIVASVRGAAGGYTLNRPPDEIPVGAVLRALEGSVAPMSCVEQGFCCKNANNCIEASLYRRIRESIDSVIDGVSFQDMLDEESRMCRQKESQFSTALRRERMCRN